MTQLENIKEEYRNILINWINEDYNREYVACEIVSESDKFTIDFAEWIAKETQKRVSEDLYWHNGSLYNIKKLLEIFKTETPYNTNKGE